MKIDTEIKVSPESKVVKNIKLKRDLLRGGNSEHEAIRTCLICDSGIMLGVFGGGIVTGLEESDLTETFDCAIGPSAAGPNIAYFLAGQSRLGTSIYYEDLPDNKFIDFKRVWKIADLDLLEAVFRGERGHKRLNVDLVKASRTKFLIAVTNAKTGQGEFINAQDPAVDVVTALKASCAIPIAYNRTVNISGQEYSDGASSLPLPIDYAINELDCNNILVILQRPYGYMPSKHSVLEAIMARLYMRSASSELRRAFLTRHQRFARILNSLWNYSSENSSVNIGVIGLDRYPFSKYSMNKQKLKSLADLGTQKTLEIFT